MFDVYVSTAAILCFMERYAREISSIIQMINYILPCSPLYKEKIFFFSCRFGDTGLRIDLPTDTTKPSLQIILIQLIFIISKVEFIKRIYFR